MQKHFLSQNFLRMSAAASLFALSLVWGACDGGPPTPEDAGVVIDDEDAGLVDGGNILDAGPAPVADAGPAPVADAGPAPVADAGPAPVVDAGPPPPAPVENVRVAGQIKRFDYIANAYVGNATVQMTYADVGTPSISGPSAADTGNFYVADLVPGSLMNVLVDYEVNANALGSVNYTRQRVYVPAEAEYTYNPYVVPWTWLQEVAVDCGITLNAPVGAGASSDLVAYSTLVGTLKDAAGAPVAGVPKTGFKVTLGTYENVNADYVCFLDEDAVTGKYKGTASATSTTTGKFVFFKLKNENGTGTGTGYISVTSGQALFEDSLFMQSSPAVSTLYAAGDAPPPVDQLIDFETDIVPLFSTYGCTACHYEGGVGAVDRGGYLAVYTGTPQEIYDNLVSPGTQCNAGTTYRVCLNEPYIDDSYLISKPLFENPPNHQNASFVNADDPNLVKIRTWIEQGVPRYQTPPVDPVVEVYTFDKVMDYLGANGVNCTSCHGYNNTYSGGLSLNGCIQGRIDDSTYANAGVDPDGVTNPYYKQDCSYFHVAQESVGVNLYYAPEGYRINKTEGYSNRSLLLRKPYCGGAYCAEDPENPLTHGNGARIFYDLADDIPAYIDAWIAAGYYNDVEGAAGVTVGE